MSTNTSRNKSSKPGFTLIELLIVIAIIGILAVIAITYMNQARDKAREVSFKSSAASIKTAAILCCDSGGTLNAAASGSLDAGDTPISVCSALPDTTYPQSVTIDSVQVTSNCNVNTSEFELAINPDTGAGNCTGATLTYEESTFAGCN